MGEIVDLRDLVPSDITFVFDDGEWSIPGDIDNETTWEMYALLIDVANLPDKPENVTQARRLLADAKKLDDRLGTILLRLFQQRHPDMTVLPFHTKARRVIADKILHIIGFYEAADPDAQPEGEPDGDPTVEEPAKPTRRRGSSTSGSSRS